MRTRENYWQKSANHPLCTYVWATRMWAFLASTSIYNSLYPWVFSPFYGGEGTFSPLLRRASTLQTSVQPSSTEGLYITHKCSALFYGEPLLYWQVFSLLLQRAFTIPTSVQSSSTEASTLLTSVQPSSIEGLYNTHKCSALFYRGPLLFWQLFNPLLQKAYTLSTSIRPSSIEGLNLTHKCSVLSYKGPRHLVFSVSVSF